MIINYEYTISVKNSFQARKSFNNMRKTIEKILIPLKSAVMDLQVHYKKYSPQKLLLYHTTITCQSFSFVLFLYLEIFWPA